MTTPQPTLTPITRPYWDALEQGRLTFQKCEECDHSWLPARECCPACLSPAWRRVDARGNGRIVSWVVYHTAYADHLKARVPYNVAIVELEEGPRLLTSIVDCEHAALQVDAPVQLKIVPEHGVSLPLFVLSSGSRP